jgi:hypothetical protein
MITEIREALASNISSVANLRTAALVPDLINPPIAIVNLNSIDYHNDFRNGVVYNFTVQVIVARVDERNAQKRLDLIASPSGAGSVKAAIESNRTLGGRIDDLIVTGMPNLGSITANDQQYLAAEFSVVCYA